MPRRARQLVGGIVYHVINRGCGRMRLFSRDRDYEAFEEVMGEAMKRTPMRLLEYCLMPNHWHLVLWPREDGDLSKFMFWLTMTHVQRWRHARQLVGLGPLYQGRFRAFPVQEDGHFLTVCRYVGRNALRAGLVNQAEDWRWNSLHVRVNGDQERRGLLHLWPVEEPGNWIKRVNEPQGEAEMEAIRQRIRNGRPYGLGTWERQAAHRLGIELSARPRGRPRKEKGK